jgi:hypothetical protein
MAAVVAAVAAVASWLAAVWQLVALAHWSLGALAHASLEALAHRSLGVAVAHLAHRLLGVAVAHLAHRLLGVAVAHLAHRLLGAGVAHLAHQLLGVVGYPSPAEEVEHHPAVLLVSDWALECLWAHWDWGVVDNRYYSQPDLPETARADTAGWYLGEHMVLGLHWVVACLVY